ncbi:SulP family inorganic anion transporter [Staphylococcus durrellii]|uniref:SulP family inorganic anion transporter n=1 Tax=Staphylococcus durrellii TaxID=2781773 RepID=UPI0018A0EB53|nr:SulP family inorganic anion transporter [Staphylococcus durrellii]MBF7015911.1 SulP family inorganic anion transporter [Staphylococcus durrellii]
MLEKLKFEWFNQPGKNILAGIVVALALIPEAIAFSIIAGVDPMVGLYAAFIIASVTAIVGGRPAMISGATGAVALIVTPLVKEYGVEYLFAATILMGLIQLLLGVLKVGRLMKFIPRSVMIGFVNALGIMIFMSQIEHIFGVSISTYIYVFVTLLIVYIVPRFFKAIPAPLLAIIILTAIYLYTGANVRTVGDLGSIKQTLPHFLIPNVPFNIDTFKIIFPYSLSMAIVGLVESLLTAKIVDHATNTYSSKNRESRGQGIANIVTGFFGGMGGCAMIGQSVINVKSGANSRLSTFTAGVLLIFMIIVLGDLVVQIPMPILAGIMVMVSMGTIDWKSFKYIKNAPKTDAVVMILTVVIVLMTHNLAIGVVVGVIFSALFFATKISKVHIDYDDLGSMKRFSFDGQIFFVSIDSIMSHLDFNISNSIVELDFSKAHLWDDSAVDAVDTIVEKFENGNNTVYVKNLNSDSHKIISELSKLNENHLTQ